MHASIEQVGVDVARDITLRVTASRQSTPSRLTSRWRTHACLALPASFAPSSTLRLRQHHASPSPALPPRSTLTARPPRLTPAAFSLLLLLLCSLFSFYISSTLNPFHFWLSSTLPKPFISCTDSSLPSLWTPPENPFTHLSLSSSPDHPFPNLFLQSLGVGGRELNGVRNEVRNARQNGWGPEGQAIGSSIGA